MPINCLIKCLINFWTFLAFRVQKQINGFLMNQFMNINVSKKLPERNVPPLMPIKCLIKCLINSEHLARFVFKTN